MLPKLVLSVLLLILTSEGIYGMRSQIPDDLDNPAEESGFTSSLQTKSDYLPVRLDDLGESSEVVDFPEVVIVLKGIETKLFDYQPLPSEGEWRAVEQSLVAVPKVHVFRWYYHFYKALAHAESHALKDALLEGERALELADALGLYEYTVCSYGILIELERVSGNHEGALAYAELLRIEDTERTTQLQAKQEEYYKAPAWMKKSNTKWLFFWTSVGLLAMLVLGWIWFPYKLVWIPLDNGSSASELPTFPIGKQAVAFAASDDEEGALTDEEIVVDEAKVELLARLRSHKLITNDDWLAFQQLFNRIHPDFLIHLRFKHRGITPAEEKLACLIRVHFSTREIARLLAVSVNSVNISRYRLRKRCKIEGDSTLEEYLMRY
jgi:DNA-binding CsgD family transcriptional regulator